MDVMRTLTYQFAVDLDRKCPDSWIKNQQAGKFWATGFLQRHKELSLRKPENTSLARNTSFNTESLTIYFNNLQQMLRRYSFEASRIWNLDETGLSTVLQAPRVLAAASARQVGQCVSYERGETVSIVGIVNAAGDSLPPVYIFPRKRIHLDYLDGSRTGSIALFNAKGYMDSEGFLRTLEHIKIQAAPSKEDPILLILDNHSSHGSLAAIKYCRENGIHMLSLPPHTSHRTQPLDVTVFGPFKTYCKKAFNTWLADNPGRRITLHNIACISAGALKKSFSRKNIQSGFAKSGVYPLDSSKIFGILEDLEKSVAPKSVSSPLESTNYQETSMDLSVEDPMPIDIRNSGFTTPVNQLDGETNLDLNDEAHELVGAYIPPSTSPLHLFDNTGTALESSDEVQMPLSIQWSSSSSPLSALYLNDAVSSREFSDDTLMDFHRPTSPPEEALDLSIKFPDIHSGQNVRAILPKRIYPTAHSPLDLSVKSLTSSATCPVVPCSQLRFGGLENILPIPNPLAFQKNSKVSRGMVSTIVTGSPELKRKEELEMKKALKKEKLEMKKEAKKEKLDVKKGVKKEKLVVKKGVKKEKLEVKKVLKKQTREAKKNPIPDIEVIQRKRGRPRKIPHNKEAVMK